MTANPSNVKQIQALREALGEFIPYAERPRGYGQGEVRLGRSLPIAEDIYSLCFVSQFTD